MATSTATVSITRLQKDTVHVTVLDRDGNPDTTTALSVTSDLDTVASIAVDPNDNRAVIVTAGGQVGPVQCHVRCGSNTLTLNVTVADVDLSAISAVVDPPVAK